MSDLGMTENRFEDLYRENREDIFRYVRRRSASDADALDAVSETFSVVWTRIHDAPLGPDSRLWIFGVARNVLRNQSRTAARQSKLVAKFERNLAPNWEILPEYPINCDPLILEALDSLKPVQREVIQLSVWEELSSSEIARVLNLRDSTVRSHLARGLKKLERHVVTGQTMFMEGASDAH